MSKTLKEEYDEVATKTGELITSKLQQAADLIREANGLVNEHFGIRNLANNDYNYVRIKDIDSSGFDEYSLDDVVNIGVLKASLRASGWNTSSMSC